MSETQLPSSDNLAEKVWAAQMLIETSDEIFFDRFMSKRGDSIIWKKVMLEKRAGDQITFGLLRKLAGTAKTGDSTLEGFEEALDLSDDAVILDQRRHAVKIGGRLQEKRISFSLREGARRLLAVWNGEDINSEIMDDFEASPTNQIFGGSATSTATITTADVIDFSILSNAKTFAKTSASPRIVPMSVAGEPWFIVLIHPEQGRDLKEDSRYEQVAREAQRFRGSDNPLFTGQFYPWDGMLIYEHPDVGTSSTFGASSDVDGALASFFGMNAGCFAWGDLPKIVDTSRDFGNKYMAAVQSIWGHTKSVFSSSDYAYISLATARTVISA